MLGQDPVGVEGFFNSVDVQDLAEGIIKCTEKGRKGRGYIMSNEMVSIQRMFQLISTVSGIPIVKTILPVDVMIANAAQNITEGSEKEEKLKSLKFGMYNITRNNNFSSEKDQKELGYQTDPLMKQLLTR